MTRMRWIYSNNIFTFFFFLFSLLKGACTFIIFFLLFFQNDSKINSIKSCIQNQSIYLVFPKNKINLDFV